MNLTYVAQPSLDGLAQTFIIGADFIGNDFVAMVLGGLYFYDNRMVEYAKNLKPSAHGELENTDLNRIYLEDGTLNVELLGQGFA